MVLWKVLLITEDILRVLHVRLVALKEVTNSCNEKGKAERKC